MAWQPLALLGSPIGFGALALLTGRKIVALVPAVALLGFQGAMHLNDDWYSRVPEENQVVITFSLLLGCVAAVLGAAISHMRRHG